MNNSAESVKIASTYAGLVLDVAFNATMEKGDKHYVSYCPSLKVVPQGLSKKEAKANIAEAVECYLLACLDCGDLEHQLHKLGFKQGGGLDTQRSSCNDKADAFPVSFTAKIDAKLQASLTPCGFYSH